MMIETPPHTKQEFKKKIIPSDSQKLLLGSRMFSTTPSIDLLLDEEKFLLKNLQEAFPRELKDSLTPSAAVAFMERRKIAMMDLSSPPDLIEAITESEVTEILFTGSFGSSSVFMLFYETILGQQLTRTIRQQRGLLLEACFFGRPVWLTVLYSATGNANVGIARSQQFRAIRHQLDEDRPVHDYRIRSYREKFDLPIKKRHQKIR